MAYYNGRGNEVTPRSEVIKVISGKCPTFYIESDTAYSDVTKDEKSKGFCSFVTSGETKFRLPIQFKLQGNSSVNYPKHNFTITFYKDDDSGDKQDVQFDDWFATPKFVLKANYSEKSFPANSIGGKITHDWVGASYPCGCLGSIDSFPCIVYYNGEWEGVHSLCMYQGGQLFGFTTEKELDGTQQAWRNESYSNWSPSAWEYRGDEDITDTSKVAIPLAIMADPSTATKESVTAVFNMDSLINYMVMTDILGAVDRWANNTTLVTWDGGASWHMPFYDLDQICYLPADASTLVAGSANLQTNFFTKMATEIFVDDLPTYYARFRKGGLNADVLYQYFEDFVMRWGHENYNADMAKWFPDVTWKGVRAKLDTYKSYFATRIAFLDEHYGYSDNT